MAARESLALLALLLSTFLALKFDQMREDCLRQSPIKSVLINISQNVKTVKTQP